MENKYYCNQCFYDMNFIGITNENVELYVCQNLECPNYGVVQVCIEPEN